MEYRLSTVIKTIPYQVSMSMYTEKSDVRYQTSDIRKIFLGHPVCSNGTPHTSKGILMYFDHAGNRISSGDV